MASSFQRILCPIDFDANSMEALQTAAEVARLAGGIVFVLHVLPSIASTTTPGLVDACLAEEQAVRERLTEIARTRLDGLKFEILTRTGDSAIGIVHAEEELNADLVVIATHAGRNTPRPFPGSIAERVIRESICPVMTVRPSPSGDADAVGSHMTASSLTASPDMTVAHVQQMMSLNRCRSLPVLDGDKLVGIVTDRDLASSDATSDTAIGMLMTREVLTVSPRSSIQEAARLLLECEVEALPVIDDQKLAGIITRSDILKAFSSVEPPAVHRLRSVLALRTPTVSRG